MHEHGFEGSHKQPAKEIWAYDLKSHRRIARIPGNNAISLTVSQGDEARLYAMDIEKANIEVRAVKPGYPRLGRINQVGDTPMILEVH